MANAEKEDCIPHHFHRYYCRYGNITSAMQNMVLAERVMRFILNGSKFHAIVLLESQFLKFFSA
jgi:hypothetical protein